MLVRWKLCWFEDQLMLVSWSFLNQHRGSYIGSYDARHILMLVHCWSSTLCSHTQLVHSKQVCACGVRWVVDSSYEQSIYRGVINQYILWMVAVSDDWWWFEDHFDEGLALDKLRMWCELHQLDTRVGTSDSSLSTYKRRGGNLHVNNPPMYREASKFFALFPYARLNAW